MGFLDFLTSTKKPPAGTPVLPADEVRKRLLAINRPTAPYRILDGAPDQVDVVAEWKIVDAAWHEIFSKASLSKAFRILIKLHPDEHEARAVDREYTVAWSAGLPTVTLAASAFRGQSQKIEFGKAYGFTETLAPGQIYNYRFDTAEMKNPLQEAINSCGWTYKGVAFGKL
jgi:outer membrane protein TolC